MSLLGLQQVLAAAPAVEAVSLRDPAVRASASAGGYSALPSLSRDGRFIAFVSSAQNLAPGDVNGAALDVFVRDRLAGQTRLVSISRDGRSGGDDASFAPAISADGRWVAFESQARNLVTNQVTGAGDVYVRDLETGATRLVSLNLAGTAGGFGASGEPELTPDGRFVVFASAAPNLVPNDANRATDVFVRDLEAGRTTLVSANHAGTGSAAVADDGALGSGNAMISDDGRFVAFESDATNLVATGLDGRPQVFVRDLVLATNLLVSVNRHGAPPNDGWSGNPILSANGRYVVFLSTATELTPEAAGRHTALYRRDLQAGLTIRVSPTPEAGGGEAGEPCLSQDGRWVAFTCWSLDRERNEVRLWDAETGSSFVASVNSLGEAALGSSGAPLLSADGRTLAFTSDAPNLTAGPTFGVSQVYLRDLATGLTRLASGPGVDGVSGSQADCFYPTLSADGGVVAFLAADGGLVADDRNRELDVFARATGADAVELISVADPRFDPVTANGASSLASLGISDDGRFVLFTSLAPDLVPGDTNQNYDVFLRDVVARTNILVSANPSTGIPASGASHDPVMTPDGRHVLFFSKAPDFFAPDTNALDELFLRNMNSCAVELVSWTLDGTQAGGVDQLTPALSPSGRYVAFVARTLERPSYSRYQLYLRDMVQRTTVKVVPSEATLPATLLPLPLAFAGDESLLHLQGTNVFRYDLAARTHEVIPLEIPPSPASVEVVATVTPDGRYAAFQVPQVRSGGQTRQRLSRYDLVNRTLLTVLDHDEPGPFSASGWKLALSADGRYLAFVTAGGLSPLDDNGASDVYLADLAYPGLVTLVSVVTGTDQAGNGASDAPSLSADGRFVSFRSTATDLVPGRDENHGPDIFIRDLRAGVTYLASVRPDASDAGDNRSSEPWISANGDRVAFTSFASDLVPGDYNGLGDAFVATVPKDGMADTDLDGLPDAWEWNHFEDLSGDGTADHDGDGLSDGAEYLAGTSPTDASSGLPLRLEFLAVTRFARLTWPAVAGRHYRVEYTDRLGAEATWRELAGVITALDPNTLSVQDGLPDAGGDRSDRYYRVVVTR